MRRTARWSQNLIGRTAGPRKKFGTMADSRVPLLRLLAMQPELILAELVGAPTALLRLAQTCRLARDRVMLRRAVARGVRGASRLLPRL